MKIQVITQQSPLYSLETIKKRQCIFDQITNDIKTNTGICLVQSHIVDSSADAYIQFNSDCELKFGFKKNYENGNSDSHTDLDSDRMHWLSIIDSTTAQIDSVSKTLFFIFGIADIPSQMANFMSDWADLRTAAEKGSIAELVDFHKPVFGKFKENELSSIVMLLNEDVPMRQKFKCISENLASEKFGSEFLSILNMTDTDHLPRKNWALIIKST